ncbi:hypothetical protein BDN71DRAFT_1012938 [Pleurotus eryngii]|uniref:F-box domain-containing protein n=1 Tax=Pleurotus eryngii TaxID=5323 RepID=A0A9P5ZWL7_PLEER|nr:hypothetical protein BDN71DRAFT_1012938 [Pleurotus eryngii]
MPRLCALSTRGTHEEGRQNEAERDDLQFNKYQRFFGPKRWVKCKTMIAEPYHREVEANALESLSPTEIRRIFLISKEKQLRLALCAVRSSMNELAPVAMLSDDILEYLFMYCISWLSEKDREGYAWLHTCRRWRVVALNSPRLWSHVDITSPLLRYFLEHSGDATISWISSQVIQKPLAPALQSSACRVESIDLNVGSHVAWFFFLDYNLKFPKLRQLRLVNSSADELFVPWWQTISHLALDGVAVAWRRVANLTTLRLNNLRQLGPTVSDVLHILQLSPQLEKLEITNIRCPTDEIETSFDRIDLDRLSDVFLNVDDNHFVSTIMQTIWIPPSARVAITCAASDSLNLVSMPFQRALESAGDFRVVRLSRHAIQCLRTDAGPWSTSPDHVALNIRRSMPAIPSHPPWLQFSLGLLDFSSISTLELSGFDSPGNGADLKHLLLYMPRISTIRVAFNVLTHLFDALSVRSPLWMNSPLCPLLQVLSFSKLGDVWLNFAKHYFSSLVELVKRRATFAPIKVVELMGCLDEDDCRRANQALGQYVHVVAVPGQLKYQW